jgi:hypothetical protein
VRLKRRQTSLRTRVTSTRAMMPRGRWMMRITRGEQVLLTKQSLRSRHPSTRVRAQDGLVWVVSTTPSGGKPNDMTLQCMRFSVAKSGAAM